VATTADPLPDDTEALKAALIETRAKLVGATALIEHLQLVIAKMKREKFGPRSERSQRLIEQMELELHAAPGDAPQLSRRFAAAADRSSGTDDVPLLRRHEPVEDR